MKAMARIGAMALALALVAGLAPRAGYQMPITFGGYTNRTEALSHCPALAVLGKHAGQNFTFDGFVN